MQLPSEFDDYEAYFCSAINFLRDFKWIYNFPNTHILVNRILVDFPEDWATSLLSLTLTELNQLPHGLVKEGWPSSLLDFCHRSSSLRIPKLSLQPCDAVGPEIPNKLQPGLTAKKQYEVRTLGALIHKECQLQGITRVVDVGSGLGYLGQLIHYWYGYQVLGFESEVSRVKVANQRQSYLCPRSNAVNFVTCKISSDLTEQILNAIDRHLISFTINFHREDRYACKERGLRAGSDRFLRLDTDECLGCRTQQISSRKRPGRDERTGSKSGQHHKPICLVGLHACGDLAVDTAKIYLQLPSVRSMILVPCCYHKMSLKPDEGSDSSKELFHKFPASKVLESVFDSFKPHPNTYLKRPFLRLASQQTIKQWNQCTEEDHKKHSLHIMARALLELLAHQEGLLLRKRRRHVVLKSNVATAETFIRSIMDRFEFLNEQGEALDTTSELHLKAEQLWEEFSPLCPLAEVLVGLQTMLQTVTEQLVSCDRICFLKENGDEDLFYDCVSVFDESVSPRCLALISRK